MPEGMGSTLDFVLETSIDCWVRRRGHELVTVSG